MTTPAFEAEPIRTARLLLEPLRVAHADEAAVAFDDVALHAFTGGAPATADELRSRYARQVAGRSPDGSQLWCSWMVRDASRVLVGTVQATVAGDGSTAEVAWVVATDHQGRGIATEAAVALAAWLRARGVHELVAHVHPEHAASVAVARAIGLAPTTTIVDGEVRWVGR
ncbi:GNAT family N-acetyltransferase [Agrococcus sp. SGAir0287]|uniref:GNAT family N-acetyltransferase n=1 Tax=Agrococcus sp. SGAir0287 TaxID=2070347 RepID=UPI0010F66601|nr:GNAT family N-acetyltransferase [Agrococcus sp. SGAir0287]